MSNKTQALEQIATLAKEHDIAIDDIGAYLTKDTLKDKSGSWLTQLLGYLGAAFIFGGLVLFIGMVWDDLSSPARVIISYGPGLVAFILGILVLQNSQYQKASTPLFLKSAVLLPTGMFVILNEYASGDDTQLAAMIVFGILAFQFLVTFASLKRTSLLFFGYLFWNSCLGILMERSGVPADFIGIGLSASILAVAWSVDRTNHRAISPFYYFLGGIGLLWTIFDIVNYIPPLDLLYLPLTIFMMTVSTRIRSRTLLLVSTFALLGFLGYYTEEYFADITGWPIALIVMGFLLIGISTYAIKLGRKIKQS